MQYDSRRSAQSDSQALLLLAIPPTFIIFLGLAGCAPFGNNNFPPQAVINPQAERPIPGTVRIDGSQSIDPEGGALSYKWTQIDGPTATIDSAFTEILTCRWAPICTPSKATFQLIVTDDLAQTDVATITFDVPQFNFDEFGVNADDDLAVVSGDAVTLLASSAAIPDTRIDWTQVSGPSASFTMTSDGRGITLVAPDVAADSDLVFRATATVVACGVSRMATDDVVVQVSRRSSPVRVVWNNSSANVNADIDWYLPNNTTLDVTRSNFGTSGIESIFLESTLIPNGLHWLPLVLNGNSATSDVRYSVNILNYTFDSQQRMQAPDYRGIALDVQDGSAKVVFNGFLPDSVEGSGGVTGRYPLEIVSAWRDASEPVNADVRVFRPDFSELPAYHQGYFTQGVERVIVDPGVTLESGNYSLVFDLYGTGRSADISFDARLLDFAFSHRQTLLADSRYIIGVDVEQGTASAIFNGWLPVEQMVGSLSPIRPLQVVAGWRALADAVDIDVHVFRPNNGGEFPAIGSGYSTSTYETIALDSGIAIPNGVYRFQMNLFGGGRAADVIYKAKLLNWSFERSVRLLGDRTDIYVDVLVQDGVAQQVGSTWP